MAYPLVTVGHGTASRSEFAALLRDANIGQLVDVRRYPGSRRSPHLSRESLGEWLPTIGVAYRWEERLGGRRHLPTGSPDTWWQAEAFRAYAHHMRSTEFRNAIDALLVGLETAPAAVMCSESLWWRCHRRLIADFAAVIGRTRVCHLDHRGRLTEHRVSSGARMTEDRTLVYDGALSETGIPRAPQCPVLGHRAPRWGGRLPMVGNDAESMSSRSGRCGSAGAECRLELP